MSSFPPKGAWHHLPLARKDRLPWLLLWAGLTYLLLNISWISSDLFPTILTAHSLAREGNWSLDEFAEPRGIPADQWRPWREESHPYFVAFGKEHWYSRYSPLLALLELPWAALAHVTNVPAGVEALGIRVSAMLLTVLNLWLFARLLDRFGEGSKREWLVFALAFGTSEWTIAGQALWHHVPATTFLLSALLALNNAPTIHHGFWAGLALGTMVWVRQPTLVIAVPLAVWGAWRWRRQYSASAAMVIGAGILALGMAVVSALMWGCATCTGYDDEIRAWSTPLATGLTGLLVSPSRGLWLYSPLLLLAPLGYWRRRGEVRWNAMALAVGAFMLLIARWWAWHGGEAYGPRMLSETLPLWLLGVAPLLHTPRGQQIANILLVPSVLMQLVGVAAYKGDWWDAVAAHDESVFWSLGTNSHFAWLAAGIGGWAALALQTLVIGGMWVLLGTIAWALIRLSGRANSTQSK